MQKAAPQLLLQALNRAGRKLGCRVKKEAEMPATSVTQHPKALHSVGTSLLRKDSFLSLLPAETSASPQKGQQITFFPPLFLQGHMATYCMCY